jgi:hypothetical protein
LNVYFFSSIAKTPLISTMSSTRQSLYGVGLLDDLHMYFPDLLYNPDRFTTTGSVLGYIRDQTESQFNLFARGQREAQQRQQREAQPLQNPILTTPIRSTTATATPAAPARRLRTQRHWSETGAEGSYGTGGYGIYNPSVAEQIISPIENIITETYDISSLFQIPTAQRHTETPINPSLMSILLNAVTSMPRTDLEPVVVRPDTQTIDRTTALRSAREEDEHEVCSVCQDEYTEGQAIRSITYCNHMFHKSCIDQWFEQNVHCPVCRFDIRQTPNPAQ